MSAVRAAYDNAGPTAAVWLAASLTIHHLSELDANRQANPPSLWRVLSDGCKPPSETFPKQRRRGVFIIGELRNDLRPALYAQA